MTTRRERLKKLVSVQEQLKALHEMRHAGFLAQAASAGQEAEELAARSDGETSLSGLFPDLYNRRITQALTRQADNRELARAEASHVAAATARTNMVERSYREARQKDDRARGERDTLEMIEQLRGHATGDE